MKHAILIDGTPVLFKDPFFVDADGIQHPVRALDTDAKLALGIYEVKAGVTQRAGFRAVGQTLTFRADTNEVVEEAILEPYLPWQNYAEARRAVVAWIDSLMWQIDSLYPKPVQLQWRKEEAAARAYLSEPSVATQAQVALLTRDGEAKGRTPEAHAQAIIDNADRFEAIGDNTRNLFLQTDARLQAATDPSEYPAIFEWAKQQAAPMASAYGLTI